MVSDKELLKYASMKYEDTYSCRILGFYIYY